MVKLPDTIIRRMNPSNEEATAQEIRAAFLSNGYGMNKANKWIATYIDIGVIYLNRIDEEKNIRYYSCVWW